MSGTIIVISGPSAVGKSRVIKELLKYNGNLEFITSYTTRKPRENEEEGRDYYFVSEEEFLHLIEAGKLLEWKKTGYGYYGTPKDSVRDSLHKNNTVILDVDSQGFAAVKKQNFASVNGIYLLPESLAVLREQILARGAKRGINTTQDAEVRFQDALNSIRTAHRYDLVMINEKVPETAKMIVKWMDVLKFRDSREALLKEWYKANDIFTGWERDE
ncbi:guanylate kinase [Anaerocolumna sp. AGMB13020]|uniref:guanylate kinase n=1 Tax=Anaerocolumna sp. AGMB13020 TaxID=3081750 RepID=UPI0029557536|nr:guanylate kinase [Anaerocolumna sp. AGMB13020]WOO34825.1 guanylate kinase [Anaerocolumna sp. AGMB13020]